MDYTFCMLRAFAAALAFLSFVPAAASAQGRVTGLVKDADGHAIKGASITAESANFAATTVTSDAKGRYSFPACAAARGPSRWRRRASSRRGGC